MLSWIAEGRGLGVGIGMRGVGGRGGRDDLLCAVGRRGCVFSERRSLRRGCRKLTGGTLVRLLHIMALLTLTNSATLLPRIR